MQGKQWGEERVSIETQLQDCVSQRGWAAPWLGKVHKSSWLKHLGERKGRETDMSGTYFPKPRQIRFLKELGLLGLLI